MNQYYDPVSKQWLDECPWKPGKMPNGAAVRVSTVLMDGMQRGIAAAPAARVLTDAEKRAERVQGYQDAFDQQRAANPVGRTLYPVSDAYVQYCRSLQRGAA